MEFKTGFRKSFKICTHCLEKFDASSFTQRWQICSLDCLNAMKAKLHRSFQVSQKAKVFDTPKFSKKWLKPSEVKWNTVYVPKKNHPLSKFKIKTTKQHGKWNPNF